MTKLETHNHQRAQTQDASAYCLEPLESAVAAAALIAELVTELVAALEGWRACQGAVRTAMPDPPVIARARDRLQKLRLEATTSNEPQTPTHPSS